MNLSHFKHFRPFSVSDRLKHFPTARRLRQLRLPAAVLLAAFFTGQGIAAFLHPPGNASAVTASSDGNWGLSFPKEGETPVGNATADYLKDFNAHYIGDTSDKVIYLTFDAGYENGNTPAILDALKKHNVSATFFLVGNYLESCPELVKRMVAEGHTVGNHTYHHPDMSKIATTESFRKELTSLETLYQQVTGQPMRHFYRPPQGKYSEANLRMAKELGYDTFFWSLAYVDWYEDKQPTREEALKKLLGRIHPGAIVLLHSTSKTNAAILDELLTSWEKMGYHFGTLDELTDRGNAAPVSTARLPQPPAHRG
jgi:peptidoglycan-N-acetylmuramic acid deacetylase